MKISDILRVALVEGERLGFDALEALGHPVSVYGTEGDRLGTVDEITYEDDEIRLHLAVGNGKTVPPQPSDAAPVDSQP